MAGFRQRTRTDAQRDALVAAGCDEVLIDKASGKLARRPELDKVLLVTRKGDQLVITKLDRLGRSLEHLIAPSNELRAKGVDLAVLDKGIDTSTALGRMFFQILGAIAEFEARVRDFLVRWASHGWLQGLGTPAMSAGPSSCGEVCSSTMTMCRAGPGAPSRRSHRPGT